MSQEHVDGLREGYELSSRGDYDAVVAMVHPDFVYENDPAGPLGATVYRGRAEVKGFWEDFFGTWKSLHMEPYEFREAGGGKILVRVHMATYVEGTEEPLRFDFTHLWTFRDDMPEHCRLYFDHAEALEAAGLRESAVSHREVVRKPLGVREQSSRTLDQRLALRFPRLVDAYARLFGRLPPGSRLRQALLSRGARLTAEALNRRDVDAVVRGYQPDYEFVPAREFVEAGLMPPCYRGPAGYHKFVSDWSDVWGADLRVEPLELIDLGTRVVILYNVPTLAQASGVPLTGKWATVSTLKDGRVIRDQVYLDHTEALEAVGLRE